MKTAINPLEHTVSIPLCTWDITLTIIVPCHAHLCFALWWFLLPAAAHMVFPWVVMPFYALFWRKGKGSLGLEEEAAEAKNRLLALPSRNVNTVYFGCCVAAVAKTWSTTGIHFLSAKATHPVKGGDYFSMVVCVHVCVCKSILCIQGLFVSCACFLFLGTCFDNVLLYMLTKSWRNIFFFTLLQFNRVEKGRTRFFAMYSDKIASLW